MTIAGDLIVDRIPRVQGTHEHLASWYTQGLSDGLGDRLLMFDNTNAPSWELLRFRPEFAASIGFEIALRERVERLARFRHPSFTTIRSVEELGSGDRLAMVATYAPGRRLSEAFVRARSADSVVPVIRQLTPALAALQRQGDDIAHGALTADRIMVTTDGRLIVREHVLGSALQSLGLSAARLWANLAIVVPPAREAAPRLDRRTDLIQLALIALSLMLGRRVGPGEYPGRIDDLLDQIAETADSRSPQPFAPLRHWLECALQVNGHGFECAEDARQALNDLPDDERAEERVGLSSVVRFEVDVAGRPSTISHRPARDPMEQFSPESTVEVVPLPPPPVQELPAESRERLFEGSARLRWLTAAVAVLAIAEGLLLARLYVRSRTPPPPDTAVVVEFARPGADVLVDGQPVGVTPLEVKVGSRTRSIRVMSNDAPRVDEETVFPLAVEDQSGLRGKVDAKVADDLRAAGRSRTGGVKVSSPFEVTLLENERLLASSAKGAIAMTAGRHELELVNSALGYRARRVVDIKPGQIVSLAVKPPNGSVSINALPWAEVWIDGNSVGETPLGNIAIPLGEHDILFRHPQLGERREKAIVRSDRLTRVSANLESK